MHSYLNKLKEQFGTLTSICGESKYFDLKNKIIIYELQFKQFKDQYEAKNRAPSESRGDDEVEFLAKNDVVLKLNLLSNNNNTSSKPNKGKNLSFKEHNTNHNQLEPSGDDSGNLLHEENVHFTTPIKISNYDSDYSRTIIAKHDSDYNRRIG